MFMEHEGRVALVTGGSSGLGAGAALELARQGAAVAVHGVDLGQAEAVAKTIRAAGGRAIAVAGLIQDAGTSVAAVEATMAAFGRLDTLVASAGIQRYGTAVSTDESTWDEVAEVNVKGVYLAAKAALPHIRLSPAGSVVIVSSAQATASQADVVAYTASKGALVAMARAMAMDEAEFGVRVNTVSPGAIDTPMLRHSASMLSDGTPAGVDKVLADWGAVHALGRVGTAEEVGAVISFLASTRASFVTGTEVRVDGGLLARIGATIPAGAPPRAHK